MKDGGLLAAIIGLSVRHRFAVLGFAVLFAAFAIQSLADANYDVFPEFAAPQATIQTEAPGFTPEQVEALVTRPIETAIAGVRDVVAIRSNSIQGLSVVTVVFAAATDIFRSRQLLTEALTAVSKRLPSAVEDPRLTPLTPSTGLVLTVGMSSETVPPSTLRAVADWTVRPRLLEVPGVARVAVYGFAPKHYEIGVDSARLARFNLALEDVVAAARQTVGIRGAGFIDKPNQRIVIEASDDAPVLSSLSDTVIGQAPGQRITLGDVATIRPEPEPAIGAALIDGKPGLVLQVSGQYGSNTVKVSAALQKAIDQLRPELAAEGIAIRGDLFQPARFIGTALDNLEDALVLGGCLVVVVVLFFLWSLRLAVIALVAIPLSLLTAVVVLQYLGHSLNTMTLGGLGIAVGLLVDDAVIVVENASRRLREHKAAAAQRTTEEVIVSATYEVRSAVVYATLAIALMFAPVLTLQDVAGRLFAPLAMAYVLATLASLLVALTVTPALCAALLSLDRLAEHEPATIRWLKGRYRALLDGMERRWAVVATVVVLASAAVLALIPSLGTSYIPELREGHYILQMTLALGTSLEESARIGREITKALVKAPHVRLVAQRIGRAELGDDTAGPNYSEFEIDLQPTDAEGQERAERAIRDTLRQVPGAAFALKTYLTDRLDEVVSGYTAPMAISIAGPDLDKLEDAAARIAATVSAIDGATDVQLQNPAGVPKLAVALRHDALLRWGFNPLDVLNAIRTAYQGETVGQVYEGVRIFNVAVRLGAELRRRPEEAGALLLRSPSGTFVPLDQLATVRFASGRYGVLHEGGRRVQIVTANASVADLGAFSTKVKNAIASLRLPAGISVSYAGQAEAQSRSQRGLLVDSVLAAGAMLLLLSLVVRRGRNLGLIFLNLPFAMVGGVLALLVSGGVASLGALVGFVALFGISLRNAVMMVAHYEHLVDVEGRAWSRETSIEGAADRLSPILMTSLATALGLLPLALGSGEPGRELEGPMAIVILGGLISSAVLNLLVLPALALRFGLFDTPATASSTVTP
jgi:CzcA family heavy metal efflux pump